MFPLMFLFPPSTSTDPACWLLPGFFFYLHFLVVKITTFRAVMNILRSSLVNFSIFSTSCPNFGRFTFAHLKKISQLCCLLCIVCIWPTFSSRFVFKRTNLFWNSEILKQRFHIDYTKQRNGNVNSAILEN